MNIIVIDPGLDGAISFVRHDNQEVRDMPTVNIGNGKKVRREIDLHEMVSILIEADPREWKVVIEKVHSMPGQGVRSMFSMGRSFGNVEAAVIALGFPLEYVTPQAWKKEMMNGQGKEKDASRQKAMQIFPGIADQLTRKKDHGRADALLIAEYGRRKL